MAVYTFSALTNGQSIAFNPSADVLNFDQASISAAGLGVTVDGTGVRVTELASGKNVLLQNTSPLQLATSNVTFANGSALLFGDNSPGTANDNAANTLNGTAGNDLLQGFGGADTLNGGLGNDTYIVGAGDVITDTGGTDTIFTDVSFNVVANIENLTMTGTANINADGNTLANLITGNSGNNVVWANNGDDTLIGGAGSDDLHGEAGNDWIEGGLGNDTLGGGGDKDHLAFREYGAANADSIISFATNWDDIQLDAAAFTAIGATGRFAAGDVRFFSGAGANAAHDADDRIVYNTSTGQLWYDADGNGSSPAQLIATFGAGTPLVAADINVFGTATPPPPPPGTINGTAGNDTLVGTAGNDTINGLAGNDVLDGDAGNDSLDGGDDDDSVSGGSGLDMLIGGAGNDTLNGTSSRTAGEEGEADTLNGGFGNDTYYAGANDVIVADPGGIDTVIAVETSWTLGAGLENLILQPSPRFEGGSGTGNELNNVIDERGNEHGGTLDGRAGNDTLFGAQLATRLLGGDGNDSLVAGASNGDSLDGGAGNDTLTGDAGTDYFLFNVAPGSANADLITDFATTIDKIQLDATVMPALGTPGQVSATDGRFAAGPGQQSGSVLNYDTSTGELRYDADGSGSGGGQLIATLQGAPTLSASDIVVTASGQSLNGTSGNDTITGGPGNDTINGFGGDDSLDGAYGADSIDGGAGNDYLHGGTEVDRVGDGADTLIGGDGNDTLDGWSNDGRTRPDTDAERLDGGLGNDVFMVDNPADVLLDAGGVDTVEVRTGGWTLGSGFENLIIFDQEDGINNGIGNELDNVLESRAWEARLQGMGGNDLLEVTDPFSGGRTQILEGGDGNDTLLGAFDTTHTTLDGGTGNDSLVGAGGVMLGGDGNDTLVGGAGFDTNDMTGGAGADRFVLASASSFYMLRDFTSGGDRLVLDGSSFAGTGASGDFSAGDERFYAAAGATGAHDATDRIIFNTSTGDLYYDADGTGSSAATRIGTVTGTLAATDITIINGSAPAGQTINGTAGNDTLVGGPGNDTLNGLDGNDSLVGNAGDDSLNGGNGIDTLNGGLGNDTYVVTAGDVLTDSGGTDTVMSDGNWTLADGFENVTLLGTGNWQVQGNNAANLIVGNSGVNYINSRAGDDTIQAGAGNDSIDISTGGTSTYGNKVIDGGAGFDTIDIDGYARSGVTVNLGAGTMTGGGDAGAGSATLSNIERVVGGGFDDRITGDALANQLEGRAGNDMLAGAGGIDTLVGGGGADSFLFAEAGAGNADRINDFLSGTDAIHLDAGAFGAVGATGRFAAGDVRFYAAAGAAGGHDADDRIVFNTSTGQIFYDADGSGAGSAQLVATVQSGATLIATDFYVDGAPTPPPPSGSTINGTAANDSLSGTSGDDTISGFGGNDTIDGHAGNDRIDAGDGDDWIYMAQPNGGSYGNDTIDGGAGFDSLTFDNLLSTGANGVAIDLRADTIQGGSANSFDGVTFANIEAFYGSVFRDFMWGGATAVYFSGGGGDDGLQGGDGNDTLVGGAGADGLVGGLGDDLFYVDDQDTVSDSGGHDAVHASGSWNLGDGLEDLYLSDAAGVSGSGNALANLIVGGAGDNQIFAEGGNDTVQGGAGNDMLFTEGWGNDVYDGGSGSDHLMLAPAQTAITVDLAAGTLTGGDASGSARSTLLNIENVQASDTSGAIRVMGNAGANLIVGGSGVDTLLGGDGDDRLFGSGFTHSADQMFGEGGNDQLSGDGSLDGGTGDDTLSGGELNDTLVGAEGNDVFLLLDVPNPGSDTMDGGNGSDTLDYHFAKSGIVADLAAGTLTGGGQNGAGSAILISLENAIGGDLADRLIGNAAANLLQGGLAADTLQGAAGNDTVAGGDGLDTFRFSEAGAANADLIVDFASGSDRIELASAYFTQLGATGSFAAGDARFFAGAGSTGGHDADDRIVYNTTSGQLFYDADGSGSGAAQLIATLQGAPALAATDIAVDTATVPPASSATFDNIFEVIEAPLSGQVELDALLGGFFMAWDRLTPSDFVLQYTFSVTEANLSGVQSGAFSAADQAAARTALAEAASITGIRFEEVADGNAAELHFARATFSGASGAFAGTRDLTLDSSGHLTHYDADGYVYVDPSLTLTQGDSGYQVLLHEIGHALGLSHPHDAPILLSPGIDDNHHTVMTYQDIYAPVTHYQPLDVAALQWLYGGDGLGGRGAYADGAQPQLGTEGADRLDGGSTNDYLDGGGGGDTLSGGAGNDLLVGFDPNNPGNDLLDGGDGDDRYFVTTGDTLVDSSGTDWVFTDVSWTLAAGFENLSFVMNTAPLVGRGNDANNLIAGNDADNVIAGLAGDDNLYGRGGNDVFDMSLGAGSSYGNDTVDGGWGTDTLDFSHAASGVVANLNAGTVTGGGTGGAGSVACTNVECVTGSGFADSITATASFSGAVFFQGGAGRDTITGAASSLDTFVFAEAPGTANADLIVNFAAPGIIGAYADALRFDGSVYTRIGATDFISGDARYFSAAGATGGHDADDRIIYNTSTGDLYYDADGSGAGTALLVATLQGSPLLDGSQIDVVNGQADTSTGLVNGTAGNDTLTGGPGNDTLNGLDGNDSLVGNGGDDRLDGGNGVDTMDGGLGNDAYVVTAGDVLVDAGGTDTVMSDANWTLGADFENLTFLGTGNWQAQGNNLANVMIGNSGANYFNSRAGDDTIQAGAGNDSIDISTGGTSTYGAKVIDGGDGFDTIDIDGYARSGVTVNLAAGTMSGGGDAGAGSATLSNIERVVGGGFNDRITGNAAANQLESRAGNDTLGGAGGIDTLVGGSGADSFVFGEFGAANADRLTDFASGTDRLLFDHNAFATIGALGNFAAGDARFYSAAGAAGGHDADDRLVYNTSTGQLYYDDDGSGAHAAQLVASLNAGAALAAGDMSVI